MIDVSGLKRLGIDEISLRKGQGNYIVVLVELDRRVPIGFVLSRKQEKIKAVPIGCGEEVVSQILKISMDLSGNYRRLVNKIMPNSEIVADRFHVMKIVNEDLDKARKDHQKANKKNEDEEDKERVEAALKRVNMHC